MPPKSQQPADPDSRARTHLANERTLLAWLRTGATLIAVGLAAAQFLTEDVIPGVPLTRGIAVALVVGGIFLVPVGARRAVRARAQIEAGTYTPATWPYTVSKGLTLLAGLLAVGFILLSPR